jgi:hypothetical protein
VHADGPALRRRLLALAEDEVATALGPRRDSFADLGVRVITAPMRASGGCMDGGDGPRILLKSSEPRLRRRFTALHELGHLLLMDERIVRSRPLGIEAQERLCDEFAARILIPRRELARYIATSGVPRGPGELLRACAHFQANIAPMLLALRPHLAGAPYTFVPARLRGHRDRPEVCDYRVECFGGNRAVFLPPDTRLVSLGLHSLGLWAHQASAKLDGSGVDRTWLQPARPTTEGAPTVPWRARCLGGQRERLVLAVLDLHELLGARMPSSTRPPT